MEALEAMIQRLSQKSNRCGIVQVQENLKDSSCPFCSDTGWEEYEKDGRTLYKDCRCGIRQRKIMGKRLAFANIPEAFKDIRLKSFSIHAYRNEESKEKISKACKAIKYWLDNLDEMKERGMGLYLFSHTKGSGKTRMATSIANELIYEKHIQVKFATSLQIINEIKSTWNKENQQSESKLLDFLSTTEVLVIDDFGTEQAKDWIGERFYQIINGRYVDKKITIFTSNMSLDKLEYDERITNRMKERVFQIPFPDESIREHIAKENMAELTKAFSHRKE